MGAKKPAADFIHLELTTSLSDILEAAEGIAWHLAAVNEEVLHDYRRMSEMFEPYLKFTAPIFYLKQAITWLQPDIYAVRDEPLSESDCVAIVTVPSFILLDRDFTQEPAKENPKYFKITSAAPQLLHEGDIRDLEKLLWKATVDRDQPLIKHVIRPSETAFADKECFETDHLYQMMDDRNLFKTVQSAFPDMFQGK